MSNIKLLIDFGSTFTKVVAIDSKNKEIVARIQVPSTIDKDITIGLQNALNKLDAKIHLSEHEERDALACSSAAGGLRVISIGFVPELTGEAANRAALGAGAKIVGHYSYELNEPDIEEIKEILPDIILLAGGTDGGDKRVITHNAQMLSQLNLKNTFIIVAGNRSAHDEINKIFSANNNLHNVRFTKNILPEIGRLETDDCNRVIRDIFIKNIIEAKGIAKAREIVKDIIMPTPSAVLAAAKLLAEGYQEEKGIGELIVIDIGGATTDVHSIAAGNPVTGGVILSGLPEPYVKRTVEGDLGVRHNLDKLVELLDQKGILPNQEYANLIREVSKLDHVPCNEQQFSIDMLLARIAVEVAVERHVGKVEIVCGPMGDMAVQRGKDLTDVKNVIGTGGPIAFSPNPRAILEASMFRNTSPNILKPKNPKFYVDKEYILYASGLLAQSDPGTALALMKKYLIEI